MRFSVGYQLRADDMFTSTVLTHKDRVSEVYFSYDDFANGRNPAVNNPFFSKEESVKKQDVDLRIVTENGIKTNLLLNGNCYGAFAQSRELFMKIGDTVDRLSSELSLATVTTTSPLIAKFLKNNFPHTEVRASVNMEIGTPVAADYVADLFDSFYLKREFNRDIGKIKEMRYWCDQKGKKLYGLANSGCLNFCSARTFHDNLVSHESEIAELDNAYDFKGQCYSYLEKPQNREGWLNITNFIRPEDVYLYEGMFDGIKLATRVNRGFARVIRAYADGTYSGNLADLLEPAHSSLFYPSIIENGKISPSFGERVLNCDKHCKTCGYCEKVQQNATVVLK